MSSKEVTTLECCVHDRVAPFVHSHSAHSLSHLVTAENRGHCQKSTELLIEVDGRDGYIVLSWAELCPEVTSLVYRGFEASEAFSTGLMGPG